MLRDLLPLTSVQVWKETVTPDGQGGSTTTSTLTTLNYAVIWQGGSSNRFMSERVARDSTHVLATEPASYAWTQADRKVIYGGSTYKIVGRPDNVMAQGVITVVPLELIT